MGSCCLTGRELQSRTMDRVLGMDGGDAAPQDGGTQPDSAEHLKMRQSLPLRVFTVTLESFKPLSAKHFSVCFNINGKDFVLVELTEGSRWRPSSKRGPGVPTPAWLFSGPIQRLPTFLSEACTMECPPPRPSTTLPNAPPFLLENKQWESRTAPGSRAGSTPG